MTWQITFAVAAERDFALIRAHLTDSYRAFGDPPDEAARRAEQRVLAILDDASRIATAPLRGTRHDDLLPGLRQLALGAAAFWFTTDDAAGQIRVLAVFFGAQDQHRRMLIRLLERPHD